MRILSYPWSSLVEGNEQPNSQTRMKNINTAYFLSLSKTQQLTTWADVTLHLLLISA